MPFIIGLTGGIATGKSSVSSILASQGAFIIDADSIARDVVSPGSLSHRLIARRFGRHLLLPPDDRLDRKALSRLIFSDRRARRALNLRTHPFIVAAILKQLAVAVFVRMRSVVVLDVPLLFETGYLTRVCTHTVVVTVRGPDTQMTRLLARNAGNGSVGDAGSAGGAGRGDARDEGEGEEKKKKEDEARRCIEAQMPLSEKERRATFVIDNSGSKEDLRAKATLLMQTNLRPSVAHNVAFRVAVALVAVHIARVVLARLVSLRGS